MCFVDGTELGASEGLSLNPPKKENPQYTTVEHGLINLSIEKMFAESRKQLNSCGLVLLNFQLSFKSFIM